MASNQGVLIIYQLLVCPSHLSLHPHTSTTSLHLPLASSHFYHIPPSPTGILTPTSILLPTCILTPTLLPQHHQWETFTLTHHAHICTTQSFTHNHTIHTIITCITHTHTHRESGGASTWILSVPDQVGRWQFHDTRHHAHVWRADQEEVSQTRRPRFSSCCPWYVSIYA